MTNNLTDILRPYKEIFLDGNVSDLFVYTDIKTTDREYLLQLENRADGSRYWLKSYQTKAEKILLPGISHLKEIGILGYTEKNYLESDMGQHELLHASLNEIVDGKKIAQSIGNFYKRLHNMGITYGDRLEDHSFYDEDTGEIKITDFGTISPFVPTIMLNNHFSKNSFIVDKNKQKLHTIAYPKEDIYDGLKFLSRICESEHFKEFARTYMDRNANSIVFKSALNDFYKYNRAD